MIDSSLPKETLPYIINRNSLFVNRKKHFLKKREKKGKEYLQIDKGYGIIPRIV